MKEGFSLYLVPNDSLSAWFYVNKVWEVNLSHIVRQTARSGMTCVDIGANIGYFTVFLSKLVGQSGKVHAFEPDPFNFGFLSRNVELNNCKNVVIEQLAVSDHVGQGTLSLNQQSSGGHQLRRPNAGEPSVRVERTTLDEYFEGIEVDFDKIDAERV